MSHGTCVTAYVLLVFAVAVATGLKFLIASRTIEQGEEICHSYVGIEGSAYLTTGEDDPTRGGGNRGGQEGVRRH